jgi:hypothetical protein
VATIRAISTDELDLPDIGPRIAQIWATIVGRATDARDATCQRVLDVHYVDLVSDPIATVHRIYDHFGYRRGERMDTAMQDWLAQDASKKRPPHRYSLGQFGLDRAAIERLFSSYCERNGVRFESSHS